MTITPRRIALEILNKVEKEGIHADEILGKYFKSKSELSSQEKAFITELVYGILRWRDAIDWVIERFSTYPHRRISRQVKNILRIGIYQVLYLSRTPVPTSVHATVDLAKEITSEKMASMVNGLLRNVERSRDRIHYPLLQENPVKAISIQYSHPAWLVKKWLNQYGIEETISLCKADNTPPPFTIRTNTLKITRGKLIEHLLKEGISGEATQYSPEGIVLYHPADTTRLSSFQKGWFFVQDEAAQMISYLVNPRPGEYILDLCAAPGGKTTHLAQLMNNQGHIVAVDVRLDKIELLKENQSRLEIDIIKSVLADATSWLPLKYYKKFDKVLLDVPCSGLGILRRHPEGKWSKSLLTIDRMQRIQSGIIQNASMYVKLGGIIVYSTCTLNPEENENIVEKFLSRAGGEFQVENPFPGLPSPGRFFVDSRGYFQTFPHRGSMDGFFGVRLRRMI